MRSFVQLLAVSLVACTPVDTGTGKTPEANTAAVAKTSPAVAAEASEPAAPTEAAARPCLPLISGCGCAFACAQSTEIIAEGQHRVTHDALDSGSVEASQERRCFDEHGALVPDGSECMEVFVIASRCGGGCVTDMRFLDCGIVDGSCSARERPAEATKSAP